MYLQIIFLFLLCNIVYSEHASLLQFIKTAKPNAYNDMPKYDFEYDASSPDQIDFRYIQHEIAVVDYSIIYYCKVKTLNDDSIIQQASICKKETLLANEECYSVNNETKKVQFDQLELEVSQYDEKNGFKMEWLLNTSTESSYIKPKTGFYYCKLKNALGLIQSSFLRFYDFDFYITRLGKLKIDWKDKLPYNPGNKLDTTKFPITFQCTRFNKNPLADLPNWVTSKSDQLSPFKWYACKRSQYKHCIIFAINNISKSVGWYFHHEIFFNGTLKIYGAKREWTPNLALVCKYSNQVIRIYSGGSGSKFQLMKLQKSAMSYFTPITPNHTKLTIKEGYYEPNLNKLQAKYMFNGKLQTQWKREPPFTGKMSMDAGILTFDKNISKQFQGLYTLYISANKGESRYKFEFDVKIVYPPVIIWSKPESTTIYAFRDQFAKFSIKFKSPKTKVLILVNGFEMPKDKSQLTSNYPNLRILEVNASFSQSTQIASYKAKLTPSKYTMISVSHLLTIVASNDHGNFRLTKSVVFIDLPIILKRPNDSSCIQQCYSNESHTFHCKIDESKYSNEEFLIDYKWDLNSVDLSITTQSKIYKEYFYIRLMKHQVIILPIASENTKRDKEFVDYLKSAKLRCKILIKPKESVQQTLYNSSKKNNSGMVASIKLEYVRVVLPTILKRPNDSSCIKQCYSNESHTFQCKIDESKYPSDEFTIDYKWKLNSVDIPTQYKPYFRIKKHRITILPIRANSSKRDRELIRMLNSTILTCQIIIKSKDNSKRIIYDSSLTNAGGFMALIKLEYVPLVAGISGYIIGAIISIFILVILAAQVIYFCYRRNRESLNSRSVGDDDESDTDGSNKEST